MGRRLPIALIITVLFVGYIIQFLGVFTAIEENIVGYSNCKYLKTDLNLNGSEDAVMFDEDTLIGTHADLHKLFQ